MNIQYYTEYPVFVAGLVKDGNEILSSWGGGKASMAHMALGISCELAELSLGLKGRKKDFDFWASNVVEELGDLLFYLTEYTRLRYGVSLVSFFEEYLNNTYHLTFFAGTDDIYQFYREDDSSTLELQENILSCIKKELFYNKKTRSFLEDIAELYLKKLIWAMNSEDGKALEPFSNGTLWHQLGFVIKSNMDKLGKRYDKGYSDKAAIERKDKHPSYLVE